MRQKPIRDQRQTALPANEVECAAGDQLSINLEDSNLGRLAVRAAVPHVVIGRVQSFSSEGQPLVDFAGNRSVAPVAARTLVPLTDQQLGAEVALAFVAGDFASPLVLGVVQNAPRPIVNAVARRDGERIELTGEQEVVLRCGKASITLTRAGKVIIQGAYVLSRSSGVNRIKGGSVQIN